MFILPTILINNVLEQAKDHTKHIIKETKEIAFDDPMDQYDLTEPIIWRK